MLFTFFPTGYHIIFHILVTAYRVRVKTSDIPMAGTNANVYIRLTGEIVESGDLHLKQSETNKDPFEKGQVNDQF